MDEALEKYSLLKLSQDAKNENQIWNCSIKELKQYFQIYSSKNSIRPDSLRNILPIL